MKSLSAVLFSGIVLLAASGCPGSDTVGPSSVSFPEPVILNDDGGWCWFEDERALLAGNRLVVGSVATGRFDTTRKGDIEAVIVNLRDTSHFRVELADRFQADDHNSPVFLLQPDGSLLTLFSRHGNDAHFYVRTSDVSWTHWQEAEMFAPGKGSEITYSNVYRLTEENGRIYNFFRGLDASFKPSWVFSNDDGTSWQTGGIVIDVPSTQRHRPYVRYASNGVDAIHLLYTEGHPRVYDNSLYHVVYLDGMLRTSTGSPVRSLSEGLSTPEEGTRIFAGDPDHVAWCNDLELDGDGRPVALYSVQVGDAGLPSREGGQDLRYRYARFDGESWHDFPLAFAGQRLYAGEDDYAGLGAIDPVDPSIVYISTNADPVTGEPLIRVTDGRRHYEIYRGVTDSGGAAWTWQAVTAHSSDDNLRPTVTAGFDGTRVLLWLRGTYRTYTDYELEVVALFDPEPEGSPRNDRRN